MNKLLKDVLVDVDIDVRRLVRPRRGPHCAALKRDGFHVEPELISRQHCDELRSAIDAGLASSSVTTWQDSVGSDNRIYGFETICDNFSEIFPVSDLRERGEAYLGRRITCYFALAARLDAVESNPGSGGGWHRDAAFHHQFKVIVYLSDVDETNGPFQYVPGSHRTRAKIRDFGAQALKQTRFSDSDIAEKNFRRRTFTANAGDAIFADTRGLHRGCPIVSGPRYAITFYFWKTPPRAGKFDRFLQSELSAC